MQLWQLGSHAAWDLASPRKARTLAYVYSTTQIKQVDIRQRGPLMTLLRGHAGIGKGQRGPWIPITLVLPEIALHMLEMGAEPSCIRGLRAKRDRAKTSRVA